MKMIVYTSNAGSTEKYAKMLSAKTGIPAFELSKAESADDAEVVYLGWVMAGDVQGLSKARETFGKLKAVVAVGMMPSEKSKEEVKEKNNITESFFYLPGEFNIKKLKGMYKMMMNMMLKMMKSKIKDSDDPNDQKAVELFEKGFDGVKEENLDELVALIESE